MIVKLSEEYGIFNLNIPDKLNAAEVWIAECDRCKYMPRIAYADKQLTKKWIEDTSEYYFIDEKIICQNCMMEYGGVN